MAWKHVDAVYRGGSEELRALQGALVRTRCALHGAHVHKGADVPSTETVHLTAGQLGRVGLPYQDKALIAFLRRPNEAPPPLDRLRLNDFFVVRVNWPTFRAQFDIERP
jgi:hypothetical protein